ncbi:nuclear transport factor 2 family protein [Pseudomonas solani]|uniref:nuclear transport factor 2 family protein n=1 Tax=Pseudomonas solani TaxID=2731552 RepID=UPI003D6A294B
MEAERQAIEAVVRDYVEGMVRADATLLRSAFQPDSRIVGYFGPDLQWLSPEAFIASLQARGPVVAEGEAPVWRLESLDLTGDTALAKVTDVYAGLDFTDYLSLLKIDGRWRIVHKLFHLHG